MGLKIYNNTDNMKTKKQRKDSLTQPAVLTSYYSPCLT